MHLSQQSLELLSQLFNERSSLQLPVACADQVLEIRQAVKNELTGMLNGNHKIH